MVESDIVSFICQILASGLNGLVKNCVHTVDIGFGRNDRCQILQSALSGAYSLEVISKNRKNKGISISPTSSTDPASATVAIPNFKINVAETMKRAVPSSVIIWRFST